MGDPSSSAIHAASFLLLQSTGLTGSAVVGLGWGMHAGAGPPWAADDDRHGPLTMTVALPQQVAQANLPRSRACQRECQSVRGWLVTARGCGPRLALCSNSAAAGRLGRGARSAVGCASRPAFYPPAAQLLANSTRLTHPATVATVATSYREPLTAFERTQRPRRLPPGPLMRPAGSESAV